MTASTFEYKANSVYIIRSHSKIESVLYSIDGKEGKEYKIGNGFLTSKSIHNMSETFGTVDLAIEIKSGSKLDAFESHFDMNITSQLYSPNSLRTHILAFAREPRLAQQLAIVMNDSKYAQKLVSHTELMNAKAPEPTFKFKPTSAYILKGSLGESVLLSKDGKEGTHYKFTSKEGGFISKETLHDMSASLERVIDQAVEVKTNSDLHVYEDNFESRTSRQLYTHATWHNYVITVFAGEQDDKRALLFRQLARVQKDINKYKFVSHLALMEVLNAETDKKPGTKTDKANS